MLGLIGGMVGASLGTLVIVGVSAARSWTPVLDSALPLAAPLLGATVGLRRRVPVLRAASLEPGGGTSLGYLTHRRCRQTGDLGSLGEKVPSSCDDGVHG